MFHRVANRFTRFYQRSSIQLILSLSFTAVAVLGMIFVGLSLFLRFSSTNNAQSEANSREILAQVDLNLDTYLRNMMRVSDTMYYLSIKNADLATDSLDASMELLYESNRDTLVSIAVFTETGALVSATPLSILKTNVTPQTQDWFLAAMEHTENLHFSAPHVQNLFSDPDYTYTWVVSLSRRVELTRAGAIEDGVLLVDMNFDGIAEICNNVDLGDGSYLYLMDRQGELIYHPRQQLIYAGLQEENNLQVSTLEDGTHTQTFQGQRQQITIETMGYTGWKLVSVVPIDVFGADYAQLFLFFFFVVLFSIFLLVFVNLHISQRISVPIKQLDQAVLAFEKRRIAPSFEIQGPHELTHLGHSINSMVSTLQHLMDDIIEQEEQKRRSELDVLHAQINPHFLYNTLDSVVWMTENGRTEDAILMVTSLARLFRISLSRGNNLIPIDDEFQHAQHYLTIQKMRYKNKFTAVIQTQGDLGQHYTLKLVVQPILENAIYHGMEYADGDGEIVIRAYRQKGDVCIDVTDNGPGMLPEVAAKLLDTSYVATTTHGSGIGLRNVHQRIRLTFGTPYGLTIQSEPDAGTTVSIRLPLLDAESARKLAKEVGQ